MIIGFVEEAATSSSHTEGSVMSSEPPRSISNGIRLVRGPRPAQAGNTDTTDRTVSAWLRAPWSQASTPPPPMDQPTTWIRVERGRAERTPSLPRHPEGECNPRCGSSFSEEAFDGLPCPLVDTASAAFHVSHRVLVEAQLLGESLLGETE